MVRDARKGALLTMRPAWRHDDVWRRHGPRCQFYSLDCCHQPPHNVL